MYMCFDRYKLRKPIIYTCHKRIFPIWPHYEDMHFELHFILIFIFIWGIFWWGITNNCYCLEVRHLRKRIWKIHFPSDELWRIFDLLLNFNQSPFSGLETHNTLCFYSTVHLFLTDPRPNQTVERPVNTSL